TRACHSSPVCHACFGGQLRQVRPRGIADQLGTDDGVVPVGRRRTRGSRRARTTMTAARNLRDKLCDENYKRQFEATLEADAKRLLSDDELMNRRLMPDPAKARVRVYATQSTHKTLTSLRQGSM